MLTLSARWAILGVAIVLFFRCIGALLNPVNHRRKAVKWGLVFYTAVMFMLATIYSTLGIVSQRISYIENREFPGINGALPPGPFGYDLLTYSDVINIAPYILFLLNQWLADGFLVSSIPCSVAYVSDVCHSLALPLLHYLFHEPLGHCRPMFNVLRLCGYVFKSP